MLAGQQIQIRRAKAEENFTPINGQTLKLTQHDLVIADSERAVALAGVMGGKDSEVTARTRNLFLESAFFQPKGIRQTSRRYGIVTDSSYRFERRVDPEGVDRGRERAVSLIQQYAKPRFISAVIKSGTMPSPSKNSLHLSLNEIEKKLGVKLKMHEVASVLTRLGFENKQESTEIIKVEIPSFRADVTETVDLIEEVARIYGFDKIPETLPSRPPLGVCQAPLTGIEDAARHYFAGAGCSETVTFSLISEKGLEASRDLTDAVYVVNPQNKELCWMRPFFLPSFLAVIQKNISWGAKRVPIFEIANLYHQGKDKLPHEERTLGMALAGKCREKSWLDSERDFSFYDLKGMLAGFLERFGIQTKFEPVEKSFLHPFGAEQIMVKGASAGFLGEMHPKVTKLWDVEMPVFYAEIALGKMISAESKKSYTEVARFPSVERDLSILVAESVHSGTVEADILKRGEGLVAKVEVFDLFRGGRVPKGFKNLAYRIIYQSHEKTLVSDDIQKLHTAIADQIVKKYQASFQ